MSNQFKKGDRVEWHYANGTATGKIEKIHTKDFEFMGKTHHASEDDPQYEIKSDRTGNLAAHKGSALTKAGKK